MQDFKTIIKLCLIGDRKAQKALYLRYNEELLKLSKVLMVGHDYTKEVLQLAWIQIFKSLENYQLDTNFSAWSRRILVRVAWKELKKNRRTDDIENHEFKTISLEENALNKMTCEEALKLLDVLPPMSKEVFKLFVIEDFDHNYISKHLDIAPSTSRAHLTKARKILRQKFELLNNYQSNGLKAI